MFVYVYVCAMGGGDGGGGVTPLGNHTPCSAHQGTTVSL